ncbi:MAG: DinB family protein, partial [Bryobacteraceae bacterium]
MLRWLVALTASAALAQVSTIEGDWSGTLETSNAKLRLALKIGKTSAALISIDQGAQDIAIDPLPTVSDGVVRFEVPKVRGSYQGKLKADGSEMTGEWTQGGNSLPLVFRRGAMAVAPKGRALTPAERDYVIGKLVESRKRFLDSLEGLTEAQWNFKAAPERWSVAECAEHLTVSEQFIFEFATQKVLKIPKHPDRAEPAKEDDEKIWKSISDRTQKGKAPEPLVPKQRFAGRAALVAEFNQRRDRTVDYAKTTQDDLRDHATPSSIVKLMDAYQYLVVIAAHTWRHTDQIEDVKASAG